MYVYFGNQSRVNGQYIELGHDRFYLFLVDTNSLANQPGQIIETKRASRTSLPNS
jgi:hypothetical protein